MTAIISDKRLGAIAGISGATLLLLGTYLHPVPDNPNDAETAFSEYAADQLWMASHLLQWLGIIFMVVVLVLLSRRLANGPAGNWAAVGMAGAIACLAVASALQAVDGVALKVMVDAWAAAPDDEKATWFQTAFAVRQIEIGLASISNLLTGATVSVYGIAIILDGTKPKWWGAIGILNGILLAAASVVMAHSGFSELTMALSMPGSLLLCIWIIILGLYM
jgi:hypothetical protein